MDTNMLKLFKNIGAIGQCKIQKEICRGIKTYNEALDNMIYDFYIRINSKEAKDIYVNFNYDSPIKGITGLSKKQTASADMETYLRVYPNTLTRGDYVQFSFNEWDDFHKSVYLITSDTEREEVNDKLVFLKCNADLRWEGLKDTPYEKVGFPCVASNDSYGSKTSLTNTFLANQDTKVKILIQSNEYTKKIGRNWRFIFGGSDTDIFEVVDITRALDEGLIVLIAKKVETRIEDNMEDSIAFNNFNTMVIDIPEKEKYQIEGADLIPMGETCDYYLTDSQGLAISLTGLTLELSDKKLVSLTKNIKTIHLKCLQEREVVTLIIKRDEEILCKKNIYLGEDW